MGKDQELLQAVKTEDLITVQKLLQRPKPGKAKLLGSAKRVNVNFQDTDGFAALHHAALNGNMELISLLLESQATVDLKDQKGMRPLHYAAWQGKTEPMKMLLKSGSSVNGQSDEGQIPLHLAAQHGHYDVSEMLLQHQSNPCIVDNAGKTPLDLACEFGRVGVVQLLLSSNMCAALLEPKPGDSTDPNGTSALHLAAKNGHIDIIRLLIQAGIDINRQTKAGTALHEAALCGKTEVVRLLLDSGINAGVRNTYSQTALDIVNQFTTTQASREIKQMLREPSAALQVRALKDYCNNYDLTSLNIKAGDVITVLEQHPDGRWKGCIHDNRTGNDRVGYFPSNMVEVISKRTGSGCAIVCPQQYETIQLCVVPCGPPAPCSAAGGPDGDASPQSHVTPPPPLQLSHSHQPLFTSFGYSRSQSAPGGTQCGRGSRGSESSPHGSPTPSAGANEEIWVLRKPYAGAERGSAGSVGSVGSVGSAGSARSSGSGQSAGSSVHALHAQAEGVKLLATVLSQSAKAKEHLLEQSKSMDQPSGPSVRPQRSSSCPYHETSYAEPQPQRKGEIPLDAKSSEAVVQWLSEFQLQVYSPNFIDAGYEISTISRMTPEDLTAIGVTKPGHRKKVASEISKLSVTDWLPDQKPANLAEWLSMIGLSQYYQVLVHNGYENIDFITDITWEDLQEIGITKLGHQKKLMLAVKKLVEIQKAAEGRGSLRKKVPQPLEARAAENQPRDTENMSSKMSAYQDSEAGSELHGARSRPGEALEGAEVKQVNSQMPARARSMHENSLGRRDSEDGGGAPRKEARTMRQVSQGPQRSPVPPTVGKARQSFPQGPSYTPPQTPTKPKPSSPQTMVPPQITAKTKPQPQLLAQSDLPMTPRSLPQSPTHRGYAYVMPPSGEGAEGQPSSPPVSVPLLCLPPEAEDIEVEQGLPKKRAHSLSRYSTSSSEQDRDELMVPEAKYATMQARVGRSNSVRGQSDRNVNRSQSFALRPKKKGPPPPPPRRSSSSISGANLGDESQEQVGGELLDVTYHERRRASDFGGTVDTGSAGSVKSIAAMLEMSSIGGGAKGLKSLGGHHYLQVSPLHGSARHRDAIGLDGEVVNRRRTISGPLTGLAAAARQERRPPEPGPPRDRLALEPQPESVGSSAENLPFAEDGSLTIKQRPRQGKADGLPDGVYSLPQEELSRVDATATLKRRVRYKQHVDGVKFQLTETSTVKRRPKTKDKDPADVSDGQLLAPYQNGTSTIKRRPVSEMSCVEQAHIHGDDEAGRRRDSADFGSSADGDHRRPVKPPVSPKPVLGQQMRRQSPPTPTSKKAPIPGPASPEVKRVPPAVSPKPSPPPTAPKPVKVQNVLQTMKVTSPSTPSPTRPDGGPPGQFSSSPPVQSPQTPQTPKTPGPSTPGPMPPPVKPPRSSMGSVSVDAVSPAETAQQKLEETSASLAAALQAVEEKIKEDRRPDLVAEDKSTVSILDDIGSMFDDLADQLDAMLE
ncbi:caskin-1 isoform X1 [Brienomyrus brachyistius]|uniref:caskin-1 isoform X1 n=1 Tax=Brienomyrus brachyistius TaxID=42636 RepID=UPI0020B313F4|nr:caskin-1 isoform X1 [Brienomyrus brachyistius]